jgi:hypothetical protein
VTRAPLASPLLPRGALERRGSSWPPSRPCSSTPSPPSSFRPPRSSCALGSACRSSACCASSSISATRRSPRSRGVASSRAGAGSWTSSRLVSRFPSAWSGSATRSSRCVPSIRPRSAESRRSTPCGSFRRASSSWPTVRPTRCARASGERRRNCQSSSPRTWRASKAAISATPPRYGAATWRRVRPSTISGTRSCCSTNGPK